MNYADIKRIDVANGPGIRVSLFVSGCTHHCKGCFNEETWDFNYGQFFSEKEEDQIIEYLKEDYIKGLSLLGGEPFEQTKELAVLAQMIKSAGLSVVCFTGYTLEELRLKNSADINSFLENIDLLIDGGFEKEKFDLSRPWVGSSNQRFIFLTDRYNQEEISLYKNKIEVRISQDGKTEINGMGDFDKVKQNFCLQLGKNRVK